MPWRYTVRRFKSQDLDRVLEIERASFGKEAYDRKLFAEYARKCGDLFLLAQRPARGASKLARGAAKVDGYCISCIFEKRGIRMAGLESIAVDPAARGRGAASLLLKSTIRRLKLRQVERITLMVRRSNAVALEFYRRRGFSVVRRAPGYYEDGEEALLMRLVV